MQIKTLACAVAASLALAAGTAVEAQSAYFQAVTNLNPVGYWPLNETAQPPQPFAQSLVASNAGSLGAVGNGYYGAWYQASNTTWFLTNNIQRVPAITYPLDGSMGMAAGAPGQYVIVPRNTNGVANSAITLNPPFSIEAWLKIGRTNGVLGDIISQGGFAPMNTGGPNPTNGFYGGPSVGAWAGVELGQYQDYLFIICQATNGQSKQNELDTSGYNTFKGFKVGQWVHVVATFDGTTEQIFTNGVLCASKAVANQKSGVNYIADPSTPLLIGTGSDVANSYGDPFLGNIDDVAIYPTVLSADSVASHYAAAYGTNSAFTSYPAAVLADGPSLYYRLNDPLSATNAGYDSSSFPVAVNYGSLGAAANGAYQPGAQPGAAGPSYAGFGSDTKSVAINGWFGAVDVGGGNIPAALNPTGTQPFTVATWFRGNIADSPQRFQEMLGHSDNSYRLAMSQTAADIHFNPGPGPELGFANAKDVLTNGWALNDGNWHMAVGVDDGTNEYLYLDGILAKSASTAGGIKVLGTNTDLLLGGDPEYTYAVANGAANTIRNFDGEVAHAAFWTNALTAAQIQTLFNAAEVPPLIHLQPIGVTNIQGQVITLNTKFTGSSLHYQWYINGAPFGGQTNSSLVLNPANGTNTGTYYVVASNPYGSVTSSVVSVDVEAAPAIVSQSESSLQIYAGVNPTLFVNATGPSLQYQWTSNGVAIAGATGPTYTITDVQSSATYNVTVSNTQGSVPGTPITLTVVPPPSTPYPVAVLADNPVAFYRLDETSGTTAYDHVSGYNGVYTNVALAADSGYTSGALTANTDPSELAPEFGTVSSSNSYVGSIPANLSFSVPNGGNGEFSVEVWGYEFLDFTDSGLVAEGYGNGGEEFALDLGGGSGAHDLRFYVRDASGASHVAASTFPINDTWHYICGVCDEAAGKITLYADGNVIATANITPGSGILAETTPLTIGARQSGPSTQFDDQFIGNLSQVALYNKALTPAQVQAHYDATGVKPGVAVVPATVNTNQGSAITVTAQATGTGPLTYQWTDPSGSTVGTNGPVLTLTDVQPGQSGQYTVTVTGPDGTAQGYFVLNVGSGPPMIVIEPSPSTQTEDLYSGLSTITYSVGVSGSAPFSYQWYQNGQKINGATSSSYTFTATPGTNTYYVVVTNSQSAGNLTISDTVTNIGIAPPVLVPANYPHKLQITFPGYNGVPLTNFPALISLSASVPGFSYGSFATTNGADLRFTDASGTEELPYEIDEWNPAGVSKVWVRLPILNGSNIFAYWGNSSDSGAQSWSTNGEVWLPADYQIVYHLKESGFPYADSTGQHPATNGVAPTLTNGIVGLGEDFEGSWISPGPITLSNQFTTYAWINLNPSATDIQTEWANQVGGYGNDGFALFIDAYQTADRSIHAASGNGAGSGEEAASAANVVSSGVWHLLAATYDAPGGDVEVYLDNQMVLSNTLISSLQLTNELNLGAFVKAFAPFHGPMDEARIQFGLASQAWLTATYDNVANNSTYVGFGSGSGSHPVLTITPVSGGFDISWPTGGAAMQLVETTSLTPPITWTPVSGTPTVVNGNYVVQVQAEPGVAHFFALVPQ